MVVIQFRVLGRVELQDGNRADLDSILAQPKRLAILAYLCLAGQGGFVRRDELIALFWPDSDTERARASLNQSLYVLRRALGAEVIPGRGVEEVGVDVSKLTCDAVAFRNSLDAGDRGGALDLYSGDLLPALHVDSLEADRWLDEERAQLRRQAVKAAKDLAAQAEGAGDDDVAAEHFRKALEIVPESESAARGLVCNLWHGGHRTEALEAFDRFATHLEAEYGIEPGAELQELIERIRSSAMPPGTARAPTPSITPPDDPAPTEPSPSSRRAAGRRAYGWTRTLVPFGLGIATIVLLAGWLGRTPATDDGAWYHANQEYLKAWAAWDANRIDSVQILARRAVEIDSTHVRAWALLSYSGALLNAFDQGQPGDLLPSAYHAAVRAVEIDDTVAAAWVAHAVTRWTYRREWTGAERDYRRSLSLSPGPRWEAVARVDLSGLLENLGRCEEAWEVLEPYAALDPPDRILGSGVVVRLHYMCRDYEAAVAEAERAILAGDVTRSTRQRLFLARLEAGDLREAAGDLRVLRSSFPGDPLISFDEALLAARSDRVDEAGEIIDRLSEDSVDGVYEGQLGTLRAESLAQLHAGVGDIDQAFAVLETAFEDKGHARRLMSHPLFKPLWDDPRYEAMLARMTLRCRRVGDLHRCQPLQ
jgi:DNA-binding SARP family transcriptional activator